MAQMICSEVKQVSQTGEVTQQQRIDTRPVSPILRAPEANIVPADVSLEKRITDVFNGVRSALAGKSPDEIKQLMEAEGVISRDDFSKIGRYQKDLVFCQNGKSFALYDAKDEKIRVFDVESRTCLQSILFVFTTGFRFDDFLEWTDPFLNDDFLLIEGVAVDEMEVLKNQLFLYDLRDGQVKNIVPQSILAEAITKSQDEDSATQTLVYHLPEKSVLSSGKGRGSFTFCISMIDEQQNVRTVFCRYRSEKGSSEVLRSLPFLITDAQLSAAGDIEAFVTLAHIEKSAPGIKMLDQNYEVYEMQDDEPHLIRKVFSRDAPKLHYDRGNPQFPVLTCRAQYNGYLVPVVLKSGDENAMTYLPSTEIACLESNIKSFLVNPRNPIDIIWYRDFYEEEILHVKLESGSFLTIKTDQIHTHSLFRDERFLTGLLERLNISRPQVFNMSTKLCHQYFLLSPGTETTSVKFELIYFRTLMEDLEPEIRAKCSVPKSFTFKARDRLTISGYLTLPAKKEAKNLPALLMVHGGPATRDKLRIEHDVQAWASRGFAVVQINFRGSSGFGEKFEKAGHGEWNGKMTDDLIDGLNYLIQEGLIDAHKIVVAGTSYGAFAVASCLTRYPDFFICGIATNGTYDLIKKVQKLETEFSRESRSVLYGVTISEDGTVTEQDLAKLKQSSPYYSLDQLTKPLLLISGDNDDVCDPFQSRLLFKRAEKLGKTVCHVYFEGEGHTFTAGTQRRAFGFAENFVSWYLPEIFAEPL